MADYKEKIKKTIDDIGEKARSAAESSNMKDIYIKGEAKVKSIGRIASGTLDRVTAKDELGKTYLELGKLYYEDNKDSYGPIYSSSFQKVENVMIKIKNLKAQIEELQKESEKDEETAKETAGELPVETVTE